MSDLSGKVALVTGASRKRGLGCSIALGLAREGTDVAVTDLYKTPEDLEPWDRKEGWRGLDSLVAEITALGRRGLAITADLTNSREITDMVEKALKEFGKIDIVVNNAAIMRRDIGTPDIVDFPEGAWNKTIAVILTAPFLICKAVLPQMIKRGRGGKIINISSIGGKVGRRGRAAYCSSKFGLIGLTQVLSQELGPHKINVNAVCPGFMMTWRSSGEAIWEAMNKGLSEEEAITQAFEKRFAATGDRPHLGIPASVQQVANVVVFLASPQSDYITGQAINVDGGIVMH